MLIVIIRIKVINGWSLDIFTAWDRPGIFRKLREHGCLSWIENLVSIPFDHRKSIQLHNFLSVILVFRMDNLVVQIWQEIVFLEVLSKLIRQSKVVWWRHDVLDQREEVDAASNIIGYETSVFVKYSLHVSDDTVARASILTIWNACLSHIWCSDSYEISNVAWELAFFNDISCNKTTL